MRKNLAILSFYLALLLYVNILFVGNAGGENVDLCTKAVF
jgi:hypothetical protein